MTEHSKSIKAENSFNPNYQITGDCNISGTRIDKVSERFYQYSTF
jgi:hypothetical protein